MEEVGYIVMSPGVIRRNEVPDPKEYLNIEPRNELNVEKYDTTTMNGVASARFTWSRPFSLPPRPPLRPVMFAQYQEAPIPLIVPRFKYLTETGVTAEGHASPIPARTLGVVAMKPMRCDGADADNPDYCTNCPGSPVCE